jgi:hypothetical protein
MHHVLTATSIFAVTGSARKTSPHHATKSRAAAVLNVFTSFVGGCEVNTLTILFKTDSPVTKVWTHASRRSIKWKEETTGDKEQTSQNNQG